MKTILITGASSGFGKAVAEMLAKLGHKLILVARRTNRLTALQKKLGKNVHIATVDVRDRSAVQKLFKTLPAPFKKVDVLVNNAGLALGRDLTDKCDLNDWETMVDTNIKGLLYFTHAASQQMVKRKTGQIINIGSIAGNWPYKGGNVYGSTKAFVKQFSNNLRADLSMSNIRITNIEPGSAETEFSIVRFKGDKKKAKAEYAGSKYLTAKDIAEIIVWAISRPEHVDISSLEVMPTCQAASCFGRE